LEEARDEQRLAQTQVALGEPFDYLADSASAVAAYKRALAFYEREGTSSQIARVHGLIGRTLQRHWNLSEAIPHLERALQHLDMNEHGTEVIRTQLDLSRALGFSGRTSEAKEHTMRALTLATARGNLFIQSEAHLSLGVISFFNVEHEEALVHYEDALRLAKMVQDPRAYNIIGRCLNNIALLHVERGQVGQAIPLLLEALEASRRIRDVPQIAFLNMNLAQYIFWQGDWQAARRYALDTLNVRPSLLHLKEAEFYLRLLDCKFEDAVSLAQEVLAEERRGGNRQRVFFWSALLAWLNLELDRLQEAASAATEATTFGSTTSQYLWPPFAFVPKALARAGAYSECEALCAKVETLSRTAKSPMGLASALLGRAELSHQRGNLDEAIKLLSEDLPFAQQHGKVLHASVLHSLGQALMQRRQFNDINRAKEVLNESLMLLEQMGNARKVRQVQEALKSLQ
jgi:tetratricopeptide (TPR) repeat protein